MYLLPYIYIINIFLLLVCIVSKVLIIFMFFVSIKLTVLSKDPVAKYAPSSEKAILYTFPKNIRISMGIYK